MTFDIKAVKARAEAKRAENPQPEAVELAPTVIRTKAEAALIDLNATKRGN